MFTDEVLWRKVILDSFGGIFAPAGLKEMTIELGVRLSLSSARLDASIRVRSLANVHWCYRKEQRVVGAEFKAKTGESLPIGRSLYSASG